MSSLKTFARFYDPPALDASEKEWRVWITYNVGDLRRRVRHAFEAAAAFSRESERRLALHQEDDALNARELALHRATLRHFGVVLDALSADLEGLTPIDPEILGDDEPEPGRPAGPGEAAS